MDPKSFTLGSMFAMKLDQFAEDITKISGAAEKELTIESELKKLVDVWKEQKFNLAKYNKGTEDRGWILRSVDEITLLLEDMGLNLQSMMASPFVRPFVDDVRKWEQKLSLIGECTEVWMQVQRKWIYLESIFIGSDDIRHQLPQVQHFLTLTLRANSVLAPLLERPCASNQTDESQHCVAGGQAL